MSDSKIQNLNSPRVLHIIGSMSMGGAENWLMTILRKSNRETVLMDFCVLKGEKGSFTGEIESLGSSVIPCPIKPFHTFGKRLADVIKTGQYDAVHSHMWSFSGIVMKIAWRCGVPVRIAHSHDTHSLHTPSLYRRFYEWYMRRYILKYSTHCLGCASEAMSALFGKNWKNYDKCSLLYCSIDVDSFCPQIPAKVSKADFDFDAGNFVVGHVGRIRDAKNHTFFLDIAAELLKMEPKTRFIFVGDGILRGQMEQKARNLGIDKTVVFAGIRTDIAQLMMHVFDCLLFPSIHEGMPLTLVEAAAAGLNAVCSDVITGEATEVNGQLFTRLSLKESARFWAEKVYTAMKKPGMDRKPAYEAVKNSHFSPEYGINKLAKIYGCPNNCSSRQMEQ
jgi:glycosyltransferase involved in cell wall biosynthesis